jgi:transposase-like protein
MCILADDPPRDTPAALLSPQARQQLARAALAGQSIAQLAQEHHVSRKFLYQQLHRAQHALDGAFAAAPAAADDVLFTLPVTRAWLEQLALALVLICHASLRGVQELFRDLFDYPRSLGSLQHLVQQAIAQATDHNAQQDLSRVLDAALDEIFQSRQPVLTVVDVPSTYCCLLSLEEHRDADTWGVRLLDLQTQGFHPQTTIGDGGKGLRAGLAQALPDVPCHADVFHPFRDLGQLVRFLENRAYTALSTYDKLQRQAQQPRGRDDAGLMQKREAAQREQARAVSLADDVALLAQWLQRDVLAVAGPCLEQRQELFAFVLGELQTREAQCPHRLTPVRRTLSQQQPELLAFAAALDRDIRSLAAYACVSEAVVRELVAVQELSPASAARWSREGRLRARLGGRYHDLSGLVETLRAAVVRASSVVENVNSRLRNYFFLRKEVGGDYLELLRFFLNHRRFVRSAHAERVGHSPAELLTGSAHAHWLELLGYERFRRAA